MYERTLAPIGATRDDDVLDLVKASSIVCHKSGFLSSVPHMTTGQV